MRVLAINFGDETCASSYYRVWQYQQPLAALGIELDGIAARDFSNALNLYDLDDALWAPQGRKHHLLTRYRTTYRLITIGRAADLCIVSNDVLGQKLTGLRARTTVIPMALDEKIWTVRNASNGPGVRIGWSGGPANLRYLEAIEPILAEAQKQIPEIEVFVHCGKQPDFKSGLRYTHIPYKPGEEPEVIRRFDIGLAPLPDDEFAAGKSPIKCIQYMASGVVPLVSAIGATRSMFVDGKTGMMARRKADWRQALVSLVSDPQLRNSIAENARAEFEATYALGKQAPVLAQVLRSPQ